MRKTDHLINFFFPKKELSQKRKYSAKNFTTAVLIPSYAPTEDTYILLRRISRWYPDIEVVIIDDHTPLTPENLPMILKIRELSSNKENITYLRTPANALKAGALNFGLQYLQTHPQKPRIVFTMDDDIKIAKDTILKLKDALYSNIGTGAVSSRVRILNKNRSILTRLQSLEYHSFNITKIADNTLLQGPLVMQGMITAFRMSVLRQVKGFTSGHLIEDYDITARIKEKGWKVKMEPTAVAWTTVPENLEKLWKQRVRWTYGGLKVVGKHWKNIPSVFQDLVGHSLFAILVFFILLSLFIRGPESVDSNYALVLAVLALVQLTLASIYNLLLLYSYRDGEREDWILKLSVIPEFVYSNLLSLILIGSYLFIIYQKVVGSLANKFNNLTYFYVSGLSLFKKLGYSSTWGTKVLEKKGGNNI